MKQLLFVAVIGLFGLSSCATARPYAMSGTFQGKFLGNCICRKTVRSIFRHIIGEVTQGNGFKKQKIVSVLFMRNLINMTFLNY